MSCYESDQCDPVWILDMSAINHPSFLSPVCKPRYGVGPNGQSIDPLPWPLVIWPFQKWDARREWREMEQEEQGEKGAQRNTGCEMDNAFTLSLAGGPALCLGKKALCVLDP